MPQELCSRKNEFNTMVISKANKINAPFFLILILIKIKLVSIKNFLPTPIEYNNQ